MFEEEEEERGARSAHMDMGMDVDWESEDPNSGCLRRTAYSEVVVPNELGLQNGCLFALSTPCD